MIVKMRHMDLICIAREREATLERLRELGIVHLDLNASSGTAVQQAKGEAAAAEEAVRLVRKIRGKGKGGEAALTASDVLDLGRKLAALENDLEKCTRELRALEPYGDFDPELAAKLLEKVENLREIVALPPVLPARRMKDVIAEKASIEAKIAQVKAEIADVDEKRILADYPALEDAIAFEQAKELLTEHGEVSVISGWVPATKEALLWNEVRRSEASSLFARAKSLGWGLLVRDAVEGEVPPTLIEPPRIFRPMKALFAGLGIAPAYTESDVSVPFMCYFSVFFAMLVGDGAYGLIFLIGTLLMRKKLPGSWFALLSVFSLATVVWGVLSNTWFGAQIPYLASLPTVSWLADPSYKNMMFLCFTIGVSHLMLARVWNAICRLPDSTALAEFGWAGVLLFMYLVTNSIVGIFTGGVPVWGFWVFGVSIALLFLFTVKPREFKTRGAELGMLPLNIMSALGDIISYVRLFAVGLASVKVAENFNSMALGLIGPDKEFWVNALMAVAMAAILLVGHGLNLAMAGLSILVHAVRLNTLEFSNHKGVTWSGLAFGAFTRKAK